MKFIVLLCNKTNYSIWFLFILFAELSEELLYNRLDYYQRGYYLLRGRNRDLIRRNNSLQREVRHLETVIAEHEDFIFGPLLFEY